MFFVLSARKILLLHGAGRGPTAAEAVATAATGFEGGGRAAGDGAEEEAEAEAEAEALGEAAGGEALSALGTTTGALPAPRSLSSPTPSSAIHPRSLFATPSSIATALLCSASDVPKVSLQASSQSDFPKGSARETAAQTVCTVDATPTSLRSGGRGAEVSSPRFFDDGGFFLSSPVGEGTTTHSGPPESPGVTAQPV